MHLPDDKILLKKDQPAEVQIKRRMKSSRKLSKGILKKILNAQKPKDKEVRVRPKLIAGLKKTGFMGLLVGIGAVAGWYFGGSHRAKHQGHSKGLKQVDDLGKRASRVLVDAMSAPGHSRHSKQ